MRRFGPPGECEKGVWLNEGMGGMSKKKALPLVSAGLVLPRHCGVCVCVCVAVRPGCVWAHTTFGARDC